jgi:hypothetical protein
VISPGGKVVKTDTQAALHEMQPARRLPSHTKPPASPSRPGPARFTDSEPYYGAGVFVNEKLYWALLLL